MLCDVWDMRSKLKLRSSREISASVNKSPFRAQTTRFKEWVQNNNTTLEDMF